MNVTYEYYAGSFHGRLIPAGDFDGYAARAAAEVGHATFRRTDAPDGPGVPDAARDAVCAVAEILYRKNAGEDPRSRRPASEKIGDYSVSYHDDPSDPGACRGEINAAVRAYLGGTALMNRKV